MNLLHRLQPPSTADGQRLLLHAVDWRTYEKFLDAVGNRRLRRTYDRGNREIMAPSSRKVVSAHGLRAGRSDGSTPRSQSRYAVPASLPTAPAASNQRA